MQFAIIGSIEYRPWHRSSVDWLHTEYTSWHTVLVYDTQPHRPGTDPKQNPGVCASLQPVRTVVSSTLGVRKTTRLCPRRTTSQKKASVHQSTTTTNTRREQRNNKKYEYKNRRHHVCSSWDAYYIIYIRLHVRPRPRDNAMLATNVFFFYYFNVHTAVYIHHMYVRCIITLILLLL